MSLNTEAHAEARNNKQIERHRQMKKQFAKMAAVAVMVLGMVSMQASAAEVALKLDLAHGKVSVSLNEDDCCHHDSHKKVVKVVKRKDLRHNDHRKVEVRRHDDRHHFVARKDDRRNRR